MRAARKRDQAIICRGRKWHPRAVRRASDPVYAIARVLGEALDLMRAPGKVRTMAEMSPDEIAALVPPRKKV